jgi:hypothetical protein
VGAQLPGDGHCPGRVCLPARRNPTAQDADLIYQGSAGDTDYYVIDNDIVPILRPLGSLGVPHFVLSALDEPFRVMIETAFRRYLGPGVPVQASLLPAVDPITFAINMIRSIPIGIDDALEELGVGRRLGTTPSGPYGVGGPQLPDPPAAVTALSASADAEPVAPQVDSPSAERGSRSGHSQRQRSEYCVGPAGYDRDARSRAKAEPTTRDKKPEPPVKDPDKPKARGPIAFDSQKTPTESPPSPSGEPFATSEPSAPESKSTSTSDSADSAESVNKDAA